MTTPHRLLTALAVATGLGASFFSNSSARAAGFSIRPSFLYVQQTITDNTASAVEATSTYFDIKAGYSFPVGVHVGGIYVNHTDDSGSNSQVHSGFGGTLGYHNSGVFLDVSYLLQAEFDDGTHTHKGSALQVDLGYLLGLSPNFAIGPQLTYRSWDYTERTNQTTNQTSDQTYKLSETIPQVVLAIMF